MLQHKWTIRQGNVACLSDWPGQRTGCGRGHPLSVSASFTGSLWDVVPWHCLCVCLCVSLCVIYSRVVTQGDMCWQLQLFWWGLLLLHCWGPSRWSHTNSGGQERLASHHNQMAHSRLWTRKQYKRCCLLVNGQCECVRCTQGGHRSERLLLIGRSHLLLHLAP